MSKVLLHQLGKSTSFGRLSLKAKVLWPMLLSTSDDQGRGTAEADAVKWYVCPNVIEIAMDDVPDLLKEMVDQGMIVLYDCDRGQAYQMVRWWEYQELQWARPSKYPPPDGWTDRIRYSNRGDYHADNWDTPGGFGVVPPPSTPAEEPPSEPPRKQGGEPPRLPNKPNLTQPNSNTGADAPTAPQPPPTRPEPVQYYLDTFQLKKFPNQNQEKRLVTVYEIVGAQTLHQVIDWAAGKQPPVRDIGAIETAALRWSDNGNQPTGPPKRDQPTVLTGLHATPDWMVSNGDRTGQAVRPEN